MQLALPGFSRKRKERQFVFLHNKSMTNYKRYVKIKRLEVAMITSHTDVSISILLLIAIIGMLSILTYCVFGLSQSVI